MRVEPLQISPEADSLFEQLQEVMAVKEVLDSLNNLQKQKSSNANGKKTVIQKILDYVGGSRKPKDKAFDYTVLFGPSYNKTYSFILGGGFAGQYSYDRKNVDLPKSNISAFFSGSVKGMVMLYVKTDNYLKDDRYRWDARLKIQNSPNDYWGVGYDNGCDDGLRHNYRFMRVQFRPNFLFRVTDAIYIGPTLDLHWMNVYKQYDQTLWEGQNHSIFSKGVGLNIQYDSRDIPTNAFKGYYVQIQNVFYPKFCNSTYFFNKADILLQGYWPTWKDCTLAAQLHSSSLYGGTPPWFMLSMVGDNGSMRGYYCGRYRDRNIIEGQVELRQHIWKQLGVTLFGGFANVFNEYKDAEIKHTLPNYGIGLRWEFKPRMNIRLDLGFTKNKPGVVVEMNEAF